MRATQLSMRKDEGSLGKDRRTKKMGSSFFSPAEMSVSQHRGKHALGCERATFADDTESSKSEAKLFDSSLFTHLSVGSRLGGGGCCSTLPLDRRFRWSCGVCRLLVPAGNLKRRRLGKKEKKIARWRKPTPPAHWISLRGGLRRPQAASP